MNYSKRDIARILFSRKWRVLGVISLVFLFTSLTLFFGPQEFSSECRIFIRVGRETVGLDPSATVGTTFVNTVTRENEIRSAIDMLQSRAICDRVVEVLGAETILSQKLPGAATTNEPSVSNPLTAWIGPTLGALSSAMDRRDISRAEKASTKLAKWVKVSAERRSAVISVSVRTKSPELSQAIVRELVAEYQRQHVRMHRTAGSREFFEQQVKRSADDLDAASSDLSEYKNSVGVLSVETQRALIEEEIRSLNRDIAQAKANLKASLANIESMEKIAEDSQGPDAAGVASKLPPGVASGLTATALDDMQQQLYALQLREQRLATRYGPTHPERRLVAEEVADAKATMALLELKVERSQAQELQSQLAAFSEVLNTAESKLQKINKEEIKLRELERVVEAERKRHMKYVDSLEMARIDEALAASSISNINIIQPADLRQKPASPNKMLVVLLGAFTAFMGAAFVVVASELASETFRSTAEVETALKLPVLITIPQQGSLVKQG